MRAPAGQVHHVSRALLAGLLAALACRAMALPCPVTKVAAGNAVVALASDGTVWTWGENGHGELGLGRADTAPVNEPTQVTGLGRVIDVDLSVAHVLAVNDAGEVWGWGYDYGGLGASCASQCSSPVLVWRAAATDPLPVQVSAGFKHSLVRLADNSVLALGIDDQGQLGNGAGRSDADAPAPVNLLGPGTTIRVLARGDRSFAQVADGSWRAWGMNTSNLRLGSGSTVDAVEEPEAVTVLAGVGPITDLAVGDNHVLAVANEIAWAWGAGDLGQLGDGTQSSSPAVAVQVSNLTQVTRVFAGASTSFAIDSAERLWGWGDNSMGALDGLPHQGPVLLPRRVDVPRGISSVAIKDISAAAIGVDGSAWTWGNNFSGRLGTGRFSGSAQPEEAAGLFAVTDVVINGQHALAMRRDGTVWAWGDNYYGQLGTGTQVPTSRPTLVLDDAIAMATAGSPLSRYHAPAHSLAVRRNGDVWSWGAGSGPWPVRVVGLAEPAADVAATATTSYAVTQSGALYAWPRGPVVPGGTVPMLVGVRSVAAGDNHAMAIMLDGTLRAWGDNCCGQLGDGTTVTSDTPVIVTMTDGTPLPGVVEVDLGYNHSLARRADGTVWAWGSDSNAQLGNGVGQVDAHRAAQVGGVADAVSIAAWFFGSYAVRSDGSVLGWGWGLDVPYYYGGDPSMTEVPRLMPNLADITRLDAADIKLAIWRNDGVLTWGIGEFGQAGQLQAPLYTAPVQVSCGCASDSDDDGLPDDWERAPIDINLDGTPDLDLRPLGADPARRNLFIEIDAMAGRAPDPQALAMVEAAFAAAPGGGIALEFVPSELDLPLQAWPEDAWGAFDQVKAVHFGMPAERLDPNWARIRDARRATFRYMFFADTYVDDYGSGGHSGAGEVPGDDCFITLGAWPVPGGTIEQQAGTIMHEIGHLLGLRHGGDHDGTGAPNYHSVMNPLWQVPIPSYASSWVLDYSREAMPTLDERALREPDGIDAGPSHAAHFVPASLSRDTNRDGVADTFPVVLVPEVGAIDWNGDEAPDDTGVDGDIDRFVAIAPTPGRLLKGHDDWSSVLFHACGTLNFVEGRHPGTTLDHELPLGRLQQINMQTSSASSDCDGDTVPDRDEIAADPSLDCAADGTPDDCEINLGLATDCNGNMVLDECDVPPGGDVTLTVAWDGAAALLEWTGGGPLYDVVSGSLAALQRTRGDFLASLDDCVADDVASTALPWAAPPREGDGLFYLTRSIWCGGVGAWGASAPQGESAISARCP